MALRPQWVGKRPEETVRVARAAFPKSNLNHNIRDHLGVIYEDSAIDNLFSGTGQPTSTAWRLAWVMIMVLTLFAALPQIGLEAQANTDIISVAWSPDGTKIAGGGYSGELRIWNAISGRLILDIAGLDSDIYAISWSPDGTKIASTGADKIVRIWNTASGQMTASWLAHGDASSALGWSPDGSKIASAGFYEIDSLRLWNANTAEQIGVSDQGSIFDLRWSPDGSKLAVCKDNGYVTILTASLVRIADLQGNGAIFTISWSPDGSIIASGNSEGNIIIWNWAAQSQLATFTGNTGGTSALAYSPNGQFLASAGNSDGQIRILNSSTGDLIAAYPKPVIFTTSIAWSPDGKRLAYGGINGDVRIVNAFQDGTGLRGAYYDAANFTALKFYRLVSPIDYNWGTGSPDPVIAAEAFSIRWTGKVEPLYSEAYTFYVTHNDGARLWVNGQPLVNNWTNVTNAVTEDGTITLAAGVKYDLVLEYYENTGSASVRLEWESARQLRQVIPTTQLYPPDLPPEPSAVP